jgi:hypothetical protein
MFDDDISLEVKRASIERQVYGVRQENKPVEPGLINCLVQVRLQDDRYVTGECQGFMPIANDTGIKSPFLTVQAISGFEEDRTVRTHHIPIKCIVGPLVALEEQIQPPAVQ